MPQPLRVLLVDDHDDLLAMLQFMMERRGYQVQTALSGEAALEAAPAFAPQVVVSDIGLPGIDGFEMMKTLRAREHGTPFTAVALTGFDAEEDRERAEACGFNAQLTKPVDFDLLFRLIEASVPPTD